METKKNTPRDFFLYLLSSATLYYSAVWMITLWYQYINHWFPEPNQYVGADTGITSLMRWAVASLLIVFPVYVGVTHWLNKDLERNPEKREFKVRKWLTYITLFIAAITIIVDLVALVFNLLDGDFTARFLLKVLAVFIVAGMVFGYYFFELRRDSGKPAPQRALFRWVAACLVLISVVGAFFIVGSPLTNRQLKYDQQRISDLQGIQWQVVNYYQRNAPLLPPDLSVLNDDISGYHIPVDPETGATYEYRVIDDRQVVSPKVFELCATFDLAGDSTGAYQTRPVSVPPAAIDGSAQPISDNWQHEAGHTCFTRKIDTSLYPPYPKK